MGCPIRRACPRWIRVDCLISRRAFKLKRVTSRQHEPRPIFRCGFRTPSSPRNCSFNSCRLLWVQPLIPSSRDAVPHPAIAHAPRSRTPLATRTHRAASSLHRSRCESAPGVPTFSIFDAIIVAKGYLNRRVRRAAEKGILRIFPMPSLHCNPVISCFSDKNSTTQVEPPPRSSSRLSSTSTHSFAHGR